LSDLCLHPHSRCRGLLLHLTTLNHTHTHIHTHTHTHTHTHHSVGLLWTEDESTAETSTWQHRTLRTEKPPCPRQDSNPQSQQASGRRPTYWTARPPGSASSSLTKHKINFCWKIKTCNLTYDLHLAPFWEAFKWASCSERFCTLPYTVKDLDTSAVWWPAVIKGKMTKLSLCLFTHDITMTYEVGDAQFNSMHC
jgi:hypothetical protein